MIPQYFPISQLIQTGTLLSTGDVLMWGILVKGERHILNNNCYTYYAFTQISQAKTTQKTLNIAMEENRVDLARYIWLFSSEFNFFSTLV